MQNSERFYKWMLGYLLRRIVSHELKAGTSNAIVITDTIPLNKKRKAVEKAIHKAVTRNQLPGIKYRILHYTNRVPTTANSMQVVDYCCWACFSQMAKRGDLPMKTFRRCVQRYQGGRIVGMISSSLHLRSELDVFKTETKRYY